MPLPILIPIVLGIASLYGAGKTINAFRKNHKATEINEMTQQLINDESHAILALRRQQINHHLKWLGIVKLRAKTVFDQFIETFNNIHHLKYTDQSIEADWEEQQNSLEFNFSEFKRTVDSYNLLTDSAIIGTSTTGAAGSILLTLGAYNGTALLASASTGTAISTLSGIAASNATLAWLGGGTLATGGLGIAGGALVLGTVATAPILLALGIVLDNKATKKLDDASLQWWDANHIVLDNQQKIEKSDTIKLVTAELRRALSNHIRKAKRLLEDITHIINNKGYDFVTYPAQDQTTIRNTVITIQIIKNLFDTAILNEQGELITTIAEITAIKQGKYITNAQQSNTNK